MAISRSDRVGHIPMIPISQRPSGFEADLDNMIRFQNPKAEKVVDGFWDFEDNLPLARAVRTVMNGLVVGAPELSGFGAMRLWDCRWTDGRAQLLVAVHDPAEVRVRSIESALLDLVRDTNSTLVDFGLDCALGLE
jgi:hypothetical protein